MASASLSIYAKFRSAVDNVLYAKAIGRLVAFGSTCDITAPMPYGEASLARHRGTAGLKRVSTKSDSICCFTLLKAWWQVEVRLHAVLYFSSVFRDRA